MEKERNLVVYNPLVTKEAIEDRAKDIQNYKNKISQEKYFQSPTAISTQYRVGMLSPNSNKTTHLQEI